MSSIELPSGPKLLCWLVVCLVFAQPAQSKCTALPVLSELVLEIETMEGLTEAGAVARSGLAIERLRQNLTKNAAYEDLSTIGYQRRLGDVMKFKVKLGALSHIATTQGPEKVKPYLTGAGFQRSYQVIKELAQQLCDPVPSITAPSSSANIFKSWLGLSNSSQRRIKSPLMSVGLLALSIGLLAALLVTYQFRDKRTQIEERRKKRVPCRTPVTLDAPGVTLPQLIVDLSVTGAKIQTTSCLPVGASTNVSFGKFMRLASVTWSNDHYAGLEFDHPMSPEQMAEALHSPSLSSNEKRDAISGIA